MESKKPTAGTTGSKKKFIVQNEVQLIKEIVFFLFCNMIQLQITIKLILNAQKCIIDHHGCSDMSERNYLL